MRINYDYIKQIYRSSAWLPALIIAGFLLFTMPAWAQNVTVTYTTVGSVHSITVPTNATNVTGEAWGGGGGGGPARACGHQWIFGVSKALAAASGGAGGGYGVLNWGALTGLYSISIGEGGIPVDAGNNIECNSMYIESCFGYIYEECKQSGAGGTTTITHNLTSNMLSATGGEGGKSAATDANKAPCEIEYASHFTAIGGEATAGSVTGGNGGSGATGNAPNYGIGGAGGMGGNNGGQGGELNPNLNPTGFANGGNGSQPGGGGAGGAASTQANSPVCYSGNGGTGADGQAKITFTLSIIKPILEITSPVCSGQNVTFTITSAMQSEVTYYLYKDGTLVEGAFQGNTKTIAAAPGAYTVQAQQTITQTGGTVTTSGSGITNSGNVVIVTSDEQTITTVNPTPTFTVQPNAVCSPETIDLLAIVSNVTPSGSTVNYYNTYEEGDLLDPLTGTDITHRSVAGTDYIQVTSQAGCKSEVKEVTINPRPEISGANSVCVGKTTEPLSSNIPDGLWTLQGDPELASITSSGAVTGKAAGTVTVRYIILATGCSNTHTIEVKPTPIIKTPSTTAFCAGEEYDFDLNAATDFLTGGTWSFTATPIASTINDISGKFTAGDISFAQSPATLNIQYTIDGCASDPVAITVKHRPAAPVTQNVSQCKDESGTEPIVWLNKVQLASEGLPAHTWYSTYPGTALSGEPAPVPVNSNFSDTYYITQTIDGCESDTSSLRIEIVDVPNIADITIYNECRILDGPTSIDIMEINNGQLSPPAGTVLQFFDGVGYYPNLPPSAFTSFNPQTVNTYTWQAKQFTASSDCESNDFTITAIVKALPTVEVVADNNAIIIDEHGMMQICEDKSYKFILVGTPPFTLTYTVNGEAPANYGLKTQFEANEIIPEANSYTAILPVLPPGIYNFEFTKIEDAECVNKK